MTIVSSDLTAECKAGYAEPSAASPHYLSSDSWLAFRAGQTIAGMSGVASCRKSRGYSVRIVTTGGNRVVVAASGTGLAHFNVVREG